jgi:hypothetical protein
VHFVKPDEQLGAGLAPWTISSATLRTAGSSSAAFWKGEEVELKAGDVVWREAEEHAAEGVGSAQKNA